MKVILCLSILIGICYSQSSKAQTFCEDVAPIIYEKCSQCHRECSASSLTLITYNDCMTNAATIQSVINGGVHAAWPPDTAYRHFKHEPFLTSLEITLINDWITAGMPQGNPYNAPPGPVYANESFIGDPDTVLAMSQHYTIPGDNKDHCKLFVIPSGFTQQKFIRALEFNPCSLKNFRQAFLSIDTTGTLAQVEANTPGYGLDLDSVVTINQSRLLTLYHPGDRTSLFPLGMGYRIPANADLILQIHYLPTTTPIDDSVSVSVFYDDTTVHQEVHTVGIDEDDLVEPLFFIVKNHVTTLHHYFSGCSNWSLISISPQMNDVGTEIKVFSVNGSNDTTALIRVPVWSPNFRYLYYFPSLIDIDSGSVFYSEGTFDNTLNNPNNPNDPPLNLTHDCYICGDDFRVYLQFVGSASCLPAPECLSTSLNEYNKPAVESLLLQPNPASEEAKISFSLTASSEVSLDIFDFTGRLRKNILISKIIEQGFHSFSIPLNDFAQGVYFCKLKTENFSATKKLVIQR